MLRVLFKYKTNHAAGHNGIMKWAPVALAVVQIFGIM